MAFARRRWLLLNCRAGDDGRGAERDASSAAFDAWLGGRPGGQASHRVGSSRAVGWLVTVHTDLLRHSRAEAVLRGRCPRAGREANGGPPVTTACRVRPVCAGCQCSREHGPAPTARFGGAAGGSGSAPRWWWPRNSRRACRRHAGLSWCTTVRPCSGPRCSRGRRGGHPAPAGAVTSWATSSGDANSAPCGTPPFIRRPSGRPAVLTVVPATCWAPAVPTIVRVIVRVLAARRTCHGRPFGGALARRPFGGALAHRPFGRGRPGGL